ncbi:MAG TPA: hypothetical protein VFO76_10335, partial [Candidatus Kapabacteria bacterium]|nr:hypothetical protein [Candidatus Kapabacteria bacterium]
MKNVPIPCNSSNFNGEGQFPQVISLRFSAMLLTLLLASSTILNAQNFYSYPSNSEYGQIAIKQYKVSDGDQYSTTDPTVNMTMDCLAANGYGQWTVSTNLGSKVTITGHDWLFSPNQGIINAGQWWAPTGGGVGVGPNGAPAWLLLGNLIAKPSEQFVTSDATHPGCQPPGVVSGGAFNDIVLTTFPTSTCKVAANLAGSVRYVGVDFAGTRQSFFVEGLNDERGATGGLSGDQQIHIELNDGTNTLPNPPIARQIVKNPIYTYTSPSTASGTTIDNSEADFRDEFDIAIDKKWLYITWRTTAGGIWVTAVQLSNGSVASSFPINIGSGIRPTIACDVRNNPTDPRFHVAFIDGTNSVNIDEFTGTTLVSGHTEVLVKKFIDPFIINFFTGPLERTYTAASHARVVVSSTPTGTAVARVYVLDDVTSTLAHDFILYPITWNVANDKGKYIEGAFNQNPSSLNQPSLPSPMVNATDIVLGVQDKHIVAFANPYDNSSSGTYNQFHTVFQPSYQRITSVFNPLILVRGFDNGFPNASNTDTRLLLTQDGSGLMTSTTSKWVAAVNQMGIHIHWRDGSEHYYIRDTRAFDEDIEEHTLVTNSCIIADGSGHGGSSGGALLKNGVKLTIWSDPNYGAKNGGSTTSGMYWQFPDHIYIDGTYLSQENIGTIKYNSTGLDLTVGNSSGTEPASLFTMPVCNIAKLGSAGSITINPNSVWEYYGTSVAPVYGDWSSLNWDYSNMTVNLNGPSTGPTTPNLKIHEGATFWECSSLNAEHARIDILFGNNINPINITANTSSQVSGLLRIRNTAILENSQVNSFLPYSTWVDPAPTPPSNWTNVVMYISGLGSGNPSIYTLHSKNTDYTNFASTSAMSSSGGGVPYIFYEGYPADGGVPDKVEFEGGNFTRICFHAFNPGSGGLEIKTMHLKDLDGYPIRIRQGLTSLPTFGYKNILVSGNIFENILNHGSSGTHFDPLFGIVLQNFNQSGKEAEVNVLDNDFTSTVNNSLAENYFNESAIYFNNSTGNVIGNLITEKPFDWYDGIRTTDGGLSLINYPYICDNTIQKAGER